LVHPVGKALPVLGYFFVKKFVGPVFYGELGGVICRFRKSQGSREKGIAPCRQELAELENSQTTGEEPIFGTFLEAYSLIL
jgi:hypothetical protein